MAKRRRIGQKEVDAWWKDLPKSDQRFYGALMLLMEFIGDKKLRYCEPSASRQRSLRRHPLQPSKATTHSIAATPSLESSE